MLGDCVNPGPGHVVQELPPPSYADENGRNWYNLTQVERIIRGAVTDATLKAWAAKGLTPWGLTLEVIKHPLLRTGHGKPRSDRQFRYLLSESSALLLRDLLPDQPRHIRSRLTSQEIADLETNTRHHPRVRHRSNSLSL
jgi:hypothetical protein